MYIVHLKNSKVYRKNVSRVLQKCTLCTKKGHVQFSLIKTKKETKIKEETEEKQKSKKANYGKKERKNKITNEETKKNNAKLSKNENCGKPMKNK